MHWERCPLHLAGAGICLSPHHMHASIDASLLSLEGGWCRLRLYYRRLGMIWGMVVVPQAASALAALQLLQAVARLCFAACKGPDISTERLTRRFPEVCRDGSAASHLQEAPSLVRAPAPAA